MHIRSYFTEIELRCCIRPCGEDVQGRCAICLLSLDKPHHLLLPHIQGSLSRRLGIYQMGSWLTLVVGVTARWPSTPVPGSSPRLVNPFSSLLFHFFFNRFFAASKMQFHSTARLLVRRLFLLCVERFARFVHRGITHTLATTLCHSLLSWMVVVEL